ncbi:hypothetical protein F5050DRAFT_1167958 [Lentinula boryana]|uniref:Uncharacterized protein n=1 Tax=Lentinula boryana TaxID=40481 RepID=A0ABQ8PYQ6_9AGAR|nr:hypothetical protein F5050DRAFT_1167958 [Lentinula boryana]
MTGTTYIHTLSVTHRLGNSDCWPAPLRFTSFLLSLCLPTPTPKPKTMRFFRPTYLLLGLLATVHAAPFDATSTDLTNAVELHMRSVKKSNGASNSNGHSNTNDHPTEDGPSNVDPQIEVRFSTPNAQPRRHGGRRRGGARVQTVSQPILQQNHNLLLMRLAGYLGVEPQRITLMNAFPYADSTMGFAFWHRTRGTDDWLSDGLPPDPERYPT